MEGFLRRLLDTHDGIARKALREANFYVVRETLPFHKVGTLQE